MKASTINKFGQLIAILSFAFGTFLFITYLLFPNPILHGVLAVVYFFISTFLNIGTLGILFFNGLLNNNHRKNTIYTGIMLMVNLPIQILYLLIILKY